MAATAAVGATALCALAGCENGESKNKNDAASSVNEIVWDREFDVVIVGAGAAGNAAAVTVAKEGDGATCLLLEKGDQPLGNSPFSAGRCLWTDDKDGFLTYLKALFGDEGTVPDDVLDAYANGVFENKDWIMSLDPIEDEVSIEKAPAPSQDWGYPEYPELEGSQYCHCLRVGARDDGGEVKGPKGIPSFLSDKVQHEYSSTVSYETGSPVTALVQDPESKRILGVVATVDDKNTYIKANKGVIMTTGGFENDPLMLENYFRQHNAGAVCSGNTGDGHRMCQAVGADMWHMNSCFGFSPSLVSLDGGPSGITYNPQYGILVGQNARRFFMDWGTGGSISTGTYGYEDDLRLSYGMRHGHVNWGGEWMSLPLPSKMFFICDSEGFEAGAFGKSLDPAQENIAFASDTIAGLAEQADLDATTLQKTVDSWNACCDAGEDLWLGRPQAFMAHARISTPPYYAGLCIPKVLNTDGGPRRSAKGEILDPYGDPIPGIYSAGEFGSIWVHMYQAAGNIAECCIFGRISARSCLGLNG